jgi:hypothetical protein
MFFGNIRRQCSSSWLLVTVRHYHPVHLISTYMNLTCKIFTIHTEAIFHKLRRETFRDNGICDLTNVLISPVERCCFPVRWDSANKYRKASSCISLLPLHLIYMQGHALCCETSE